jgi:hypothetical protein
MTVKRRFVIRDGSVVEIPVSERLRGERSAGEGLQIINDINPYASPVDDRYIGSRREHREDLKRNRCHVLERGEKEHFQKNFNRDSEARMERFVDSAVDGVARDLFA